MKYTIKHHELNNQYYVVSKNPVLTYDTVIWFDTKLDAQEYVKDQIIKNEKMMSDVISINDYFKIDQATSFKNTLAQ
jgi:hypothetical protein